MILADNAPKVNLTTEQTSVVNSILEFARKPYSSSKHENEFRLGGLAGTGKTLTLSVAAKSLAAHGYSVVVACPTAKAASNLQEKGITDTMTLHKLLKYSRPNYSPNGQHVIGYMTTPRESLKGVEIVIVDEASMVRRSDYDLLMSHGIPVIFCGDYGQLPPFGEQPLELLTAQNRDATLHTIHRQDSVSPILLAAHKVRKGQALTDSCNVPGELSVETGKNVTPYLLFLETDMVIVDTNSTRIGFNKMCRRSAKITSSRPQAGEPVMCLQNSSDLGVFNGQVFTIVSIIDNGTDVCKTLIRTAAGETILVPMWMGGFNKEEEATKGKIGAVKFDYAYAITCHKAQGSEWDSVAVIDKGAHDGATWRYTAITRAAKHLRYIQ
jgi:exodeoxyribonuclease-5